MLLRKPRSYAEIWNDLDDEVVGLFRVLRCPDASRALRTALELTPFARREFYQAYELTTEPVERARRLLVRSFMGFGSDGYNTDVRTGFRATSNRSGTTPAHDWQNFPPNVARLRDRLAGVVIEARDAVEVMQQHDGAQTLHYVDPPYVPATRSTLRRRRGMPYHVYRHEMTDDDHRRLAEVLARLEGMVVLSGYESALYNELYAGWGRRTLRTFADGARERREVLWLNPACTAALEATCTQRRLLA